MRVLNIFDVQTICLDGNSLLESLHSRANRNKEKRSLEDKSENKENDT